MKGLTEKEVIQNRKKYGTNEIINSKTNSFLKLLLESLGDPIIKILLIALGIKTILLIQNFDWYETVGIVIAIFIASFVSSISEYGSEKAFSKLQEEASQIKCHVIRDRKTKEINITEVVKDDLVILETGDKVPADGIIIDGSVLIDESALTGETKEKEKNLNDELFRGSTVYSKRCIMKVTKVGINTTYGKLAQELSEKSPDSPLKIRLRHLAQIISKIGYIGAFLVAISYLFSVIVIKNSFNHELIINTLTNIPYMIGHILYALTLCVTVIVVSVPEGLPMMITLVLSSNMKKMLKNNVLVRKLVGIETAGNLNILFTDKTGTLTKGKLKVTKIITGDLKEYKSEEEIKNKIKNFIYKSMVYNNGSYYADGKIVGGNSTDKAMLEFIQSPIINIEKEVVIPFDSKNKYMMTTIEEDNKIRLIKGAPEKIIPNCTKYYTEYGDKRSFYNKNKIKEEIEKATKQGIRVVAMAISDSYSLDDFENLSFVGLVFIKDQIRAEAKEGIKLVKEAHINIVMITGDNKDTAESIANDLNMLDHNSLILTSDELSRLDDEAIKKILPNLKVVARALPHDKSRLVKLAQEEKLIVGMTGDGVNDSPALKKADVGFAMGSGTEVAKEASDIVILDDNFLSIAKAILFGRTIFKSIRKFIIFQLTVNFCAISLSIIGPFIGVNTPITVIQMLWINMVMDTLAGLAFSFEAPSIEYMKEYPKKNNESIINKYMFSEIFVTGLYSSIICILFLKLPIFTNFFKDNLMTAFFALFIFLGIFNAFNARTTRINLLANILKNKMFIIIISVILIVQLFLIYYGGSLFRTNGLSLIELIFVLFISFSVIFVDWFRKIILKRKKYQFKI